MNKNMIYDLIVAIVVATIITSIVITNKYRDNNNNHKQEVKYENGKFNLNLIKTVNADKQSNYLISPYSIELALNLLKEGANGETLNELENTIGTREINDVTIKNRIGVANAAFIKNKYKSSIEKEYYDILKDKYNGEILYDEFKTPKVINDWVNKKTNGMIDKILNSISPDFALGLANALAIDVEWDSPFDCNSTTSEPFEKIDNKKINVEMMHKTYRSGIKYLENDYAKGVIIPYKAYDPKTGEIDYEKGNSLEFIAIMPNNELPKYINDLTEEKLKNLESTATEPTNELEIKLAIPRFKYDYSLDEFKEVLTKMGIKLTFDSESADFTKIMKSNPEYGNLYVGEAIHKTHIDLNEKGTKAAAVTYFGMFTSGMIMEKESISISFDKPFMYIIRDASTKEMLFFGTVYEPNKWQGSTCSKES